MSNIYVIKCSIGNSPEVGGYLSIYSDTEYTITRAAARHFDSLLSADSYAAALDMQYPGWTHIVEVL